MNAARHVLLLAAALSACAGTQPEKQPSAPLDAGKTPPEFVGSYRLVTDNATPQNLDILSFPWFQYAVVGCDFFYDIAAPLQFFDGGIVVYSGSPNFSPDFVLFHLAEGGFISNLNERWIPGNECLVCSSRPGQAATMDKVDCDFEYQHDAGF
jgi:hypothetical protein